MISKTSLLLLIFLTCSHFVYPQWKAGASYSSKSGTPENGFGVSLSRNLPFQWPLIGFSVRAEANIYGSNTTLSGENNPVITQLNQTDIHLNVIGTFYPRNIQPYAGLGFGVSSMTYEMTNRGIEELNNTRLRKNYFFIEGLTGIQLSVVRHFYPFIEAHLVRYFTTFSEINSNISSLQFCWSIGLKIGFDTL